MNIDWKCDNCQESHSKLIAPFYGDSEKYCLACFSFNLGLAASNKPDLNREHHYNWIAIQAQRQLEQSKTNSVVFVSKDTDQKKMKEWLEKFTKQKNK